MKYTHIRKILRYTAIIICLFFTCEYSLASTVIVKVGPGTDEFAKKIGQSLPNAYLTDSVSDPKLKEASLIITIGISSLIGMSSEISSPVIASFVPYNSFNALPHSKKHNAYAVFMEPNPKQLVKSLSDTFGENSKIGYITKSDDLYFQLLSEVSGVDFVSIESQGKTFKSLSTLYSRHRLDGFYISEERDIFNQSNILLVLESLYRKRIPSITTNKFLIGRGAVYSLYVDYDDIVEKTIALAKSVIAQKDVNRNNFCSLNESFDEKLALKIGFSMSEVRQ